MFKDFFGGLGPVKLVKEGMREFGDDDVSGLAAELTYRLFLTMFPIFILLAAIGGFAAKAIGVRDPTNQILNTVGATIPGEAAELLRKAVTEVIGSTNPALLSIGILGTVWAASGAVNAIMKATNRVYEVPETRPFWKRYGISIGLTLLAGLFVVGSFLIMAAGQFYGSRIAEAMGIGGPFLSVFPWLRFIVAPILLMIGVAVLYWAAPNTGMPFKLVTPGAVLFVLVWLVSSFLFGLYVANFGEYNATYGALGAVALLLVWMYYSNIILLLGVEMNAIVNEAVMPEKLAKIRLEKEAKAKAERRKEEPVKLKGRPAPVLLAEASKKKTGESSVAVDVSLEKRPQRLSKSVSSIVGSIIVGVAALGFWLRERLRRQAEARKRAPRLLARLKVASTAKQKEEKERHQKAA